MPIIRRKIPGSKKVVLVRYPKSFFPRLKPTPGPAKKTAAEKMDVDLADEKDQKWLQEEVLGKDEGGFFSSLKPAKKRVPVAMPV